jgi:cation diffusion facilitator family transporter
MNKNKYGYIEGFLSILINTILFFLKIIAGKKSGSISMIADAWHTLSDSLTSLVVIYGFWISSIPKDKEHPFGHGRAEVISSIIIGTLLAIVGFNFLIDSFKNFLNKKSSIFDITGIIIFLISVVVKEALASFSIILGKKTNSRSLIADGWHHRSDALASLLIVIGIIFSKNLWWIDSILGVLVSLLIIYTAFDIIKGGSNILLGENPDEEMDKKLKDIIKNCTPELNDIHHIHIHKYGDHIEITLHARMAGETTINKAHDICNILEKEIKKELNADATLHIEPEK